MHAWIGDEARRLQPPDADICDACADLGCADCPECDHHQQEPDPDDAYDRMREARWEDDL